MIDSVFKKVQSQIGALTVCLATLTMPGSERTPDRAENPIASQKDRGDGQPVRESAAAKIIRETVAGLPSIDPSIGCKVSETQVEGAEALLVVVRYAHVRQEDFSKFRPETRTALMEAQVQVEQLLRTLSAHLRVQSLTGDGLRSGKALELSGYITDIHETRKTLGSIANFRNAQSALEQCEAALRSLPPTDPTRRQWVQLQGAINSRFELFDRTLVNHTQMVDYLESEAKDHPFVKVALERGLELFCVEEPSLLDQSLRIAHDPNGSDAEFDQLSELRESFILGQVADRDGKSSRRVVLLCMGALHRFENNALETLKLLPKQRVSVVEFSPTALPDKLGQLKALFQ